MFSRVTFASALSLTLLIGSCDPPTDPPPPPASSTIPADVPTCRTPPCPIPEPRDTRVLVTAPATVTAQPERITTTVPTVTVPAGPVGVWQHPDPQIEQWHQVALDAGWPESSWPRLSCIIRRESGGQPAAHNPRDPGLGSYGLLQLNLSLGNSGTWALWGPSLGWDATRLYDPATNLTYGHELYERAQRMWGAGWRPWGPGRC